MNLKPQKINIARSKWWDDDAIMTQHIVYIKIGTERLEIQLQNYKEKAREIIEQIAMHEHISADGLNAAS